VRNRVGKLKNYLDEKPTLLKEAWLAHKNWHS